MEIIKYPSVESWKNLVLRPQMEATGLDQTVRSVLDQVKAHGDTAVKEYTQKFDGVSIDQLLVPTKEVLEASGMLSDELKEAIDLASENIRKFHAAQIMAPVEVETTPGVKCWQKAVGIEKVGLYIPGGTAPLFSTVLMLAIPANIAGCGEIILCTPPNKEGKIHPAILYAAKVAGITQVFKIGGVQAIGAMAYGTETIPEVYKIFGPGNQYVTAAKRLVSTEMTAIDMPAGPSEVQVIADETANPAFIASDLLSQAEHGVDSQVILTTTSEALLQDVQKELALQLDVLPRKAFAAKALENSRMLVFTSKKEIMEFTNLYAPEHLIISTNDYMDLALQVRNAGSVFLGKFTPESAGDYASGTNHTLPTYGYAKMYSGVNLDSFTKKITFQEITRKGIQNIGPAIEIMAETEQLFAHKNAVTLRLRDL